MAGKTYILRDLSGRSSRMSNNHCIFDTCPVDEGIFPFYLASRTPNNGPLIHSTDIGAVSSQKSSLWIQICHQLHALLVHGKDDTSAHNQTRQPRHSSAPESQESLLFEDHSRASKRVPILATSLGTLHPRLDRIQRLRYVDRDDTRQCTHRKRTRRSKLLSWCGVALSQLLQGGVRPESGGAVRGLSGGGGHKTLEEASNATLAGDDGDSVNETTESGFSRLSVVDPGVSASALHSSRLTMAYDSQCSLDTLRRRHSEQRLCNSSAKTSNHRPRSRYLALSIGE